VVLADEPTVYPPSGIQVFLGLDDTSVPTQVQDGRASEIENVKLDVSKGMRQRFGYSRVGDAMDQGQSEGGVDLAPCAVTGLYYTKFSSGVERIVSTCGGQFHYFSGTAWATVTGLTVGLTSGQNNQFVWATALDEIIGTNDVDAPLRYDGTTLANVNLTSLSASSRPTKAKTVAFFKNFLILGNTVELGVERPTRIRWSNVGSTTTWTDVDFIDIGALGGQEINAMAELYDNLYVFLTDSIYRVSFVAGAETFQVSKVTDDIGCIAKNSVQSVTLTNAQNGLAFLDKDKRVYFFDGIAAKELSPLIRTTMEGLSATGLQYAVSADSNTDYYLCVRNGTSGINNLCLDFQYQIGEWTKYTNVSANAMAHVLDNNNRDQVYFGSYESFVYQLEDDDLKDDVGSAQGAVTAVQRFDTTTSSGLQVLYTDITDMTTGALAGAPITLLDGTGMGLTSTIMHNTATGLVVSDDFTITPSIGTSVEVGAIDSTYATKWYDLSEPFRLKHFGEVYFWGENGTSTMTVSYAVDFNTNISNQEISISSDTDDATWGSGTWGVSLWGSSSDIFRQVKLETGGRYVRVTWAEDDPGQAHHLYGWNMVYWRGDGN